MVKESSTNMSCTGYQLVKPKSIEPLTEAVSLFLETKVKVANYQKRPHRYENRFNVSPELVQWLTLRSIHIDNVNDGNVSFSNWRVGETKLDAVQFLL